MKRCSLSLLLFIGLSSGLMAQFNLGKISDGISKYNQAKSTADDAKNKAKTVGQVAKGVAGIGPEEERVIGDSVAVEIVGKYGGLDRDQAATERLNLIGKSLARYSSRPALEWRFALLDSDSVNAFSAPGGYVFLTKGLYALLDSDDAVAAVLSHEIAHITLKHALKIVSRGEFITGASTLAVQYSRDANIVNSQLSQFDTGIQDITKTLFEKGFDPMTEYEADKKGRELEITTGYSSGAYRAMLTQLKALPATDAATKPFPTHPSLDARLSKLPADSK